MTNYNSSITFTKNKTTTLKSSENVSSLQEDVIIELILTVEATLS